MKTKLLQNSLNLNSTKLKYLFIFLEPSDIPEGCKTLFIRNLPYDMKED